MYTPYLPIEKKIYKRKERGSFPHTRHCVPDILFTKEDPVTHTGLGVEMDVIYPHFTLTPFSPIFLFSHNLLDYLTPCVKIIIGGFPNAKISEQDQGHQGLT